MKHKSETFEKFREFQNEMLKINMARKLRLYDLIMEASI